MLPGPEQADREPQPAEHKHEAEARGFRHFAKLRQHIVESSPRTARRAWCSPATGTARYVAGNFHRATARTRTVVAAGLPSSFHFHELRHTGNHLAATSGAPRPRRSRHDETAIPVSHRGNAPVLARIWHAPSRTKSAAACLATG